MSRLELLWVKTFVAIFIIVLSVYAIGRHNRFNSSALDLGIQDNVLWNTIHGRPFASSIETPNYLGDHVTLTIPLFSLLYLIWENVRIVLIAQVVLLALGAFPLSTLAAEKLKRPGSGPAVALAYLLYPPLAFICRFDFHPEVAVLPLFLFAVLCFERKKNAWGYLLTFLALVSKEQIGMVIGFWGISLWAFEKNWRRGLLFIILGFGWSWIALFQIIPHFRGTPSDTLDRYSELSVGSGELLYLWQLLWPLAGLCFLCPRLFLVAVPVLAYNLLSENVNQHCLFYQYNAPAIPWLFLGAIEGLAWLQSRTFRTRNFKPVARYWLWALPLCCALAFVHYKPFTAKIRPPHFEVYGWEEVDNAAQIQEAAAMIPPDAELTTTMALLPHFSHRRGIFLWWQGAYFDSEYLLGNLYDHRWWTLSRNQYLDGLRKAIDEHGHKVIYFRNGVVLTAKSSPRKDRTQEVRQFLDFSRVTGPLAVDLEWDPRGDLLRTFYNTGWPLKDPFAPNKGFDNSGRSNLYVAYEFLPRGKGKALALLETGRVKSWAGAERYGDARGILPIFADIELSADHQGYYLLDHFGRVHAFGSARHLGDDREQDDSGRAIDLELTPGGKGYLILRSHGRVASFGDARLNSPRSLFGWDIARDLCLTGTDSGYILDGFGGIHSLGNAPPLRCDAYCEEDRMVDLEFDPQGRAYLLDRDGKLYPVRPAEE